jgi:hypothetical protein
MLIWAKRARSRWMQPSDSARHAFSDVSRGNAPALASTVSKPSPATSSSRPSGKGASSVPPMWQILGYMNDLGYRAHHIRASVSPTAVLPICPNYDLRAEFRRFSGTSARHSASAMKRIGPSQCAAMAPAVLPRKSTSPGRRFTPITMRSCLAAYLRIGASGEAPLSIAVRTSTP